eukprot:TRINITY_DN5249_c3_g1_i1.p1 TRINITY_DN5249_c3_g1~~TRINITY_DN5249_c3_g1_i1.p1  ORF type:complete len:795 (+),score=145.36 TRINITY_DN5249_c3_g1_i1:152-2536(+)
MGNTIPGGGKLLSPNGRGGWLLCLDEEQRAKCMHRLRTVSGGCDPSSSSSATRPNDARIAAEGSLEGLTQELFRLQDLNKDGFLDENELVKLNEKIAMLHYGKDTDLNAVKVKYKNHFRDNLDPNGDPIPYERFREYIVGVLASVDPDPRAQEMVLEQWIAEAESARAAFFCRSMGSESDFEYLTKISFNDAMVFGNQSQSQPSTGPGSKGIDPCSTGGGYVSSGSSPGGPSEASTLPSAPHAMGSLNRGTAQSATFPGAGYPGSNAETPKFASCDSFGLGRLPPEMGSMAKSDLQKVGTGPVVSTNVSSPNLFRPPTAGSMTEMQQTGFQGAQDSSEFVPHPDHMKGSVDASSFVPHPNLNDSSLVRESTFVPHPNLMQGSVNDSFVPHPNMKASAAYSSSEMDSLSFIPHPGADGNDADFARGSSLNRRNPTDQVPAPSKTSIVYDSKQSSCAFQAGEGLEVWSESKQAWLPGVVQAAYEFAAKVDGFDVPAGTLKVTYGTGAKWVLPKEVAKILRKAGSLEMKYKKGDRVQVWSDSKQTWLDAVVKGAFSEASRGDGFTIPAGSYKVAADAGSVKWILPEQVDKLLRQQPQQPGPVGSIQMRGREISSVLSSFADRKDPGYTKGEKVQVFSESKGQWIGGIVQASFCVSCAAEGFAVPAGTVKVVSETGEKWVLPDQLDHILRKAPEGQQPDLKSMLNTFLQDPATLKRLSDEIWNAALQPGEEGLPPERAAWALEGMADKFGLRLELEGQPLAAIKGKAESYASVAKSSLTADEFLNLCREVMFELHGAL